MFLPVGAAASALSTFVSPQQASATATSTSPSTSTVASTAPQASIFDALASGGTGSAPPVGSGITFMPLSPDMMSAMISAQSQQTDGQTNTTTTDSQQGTLASEDTGGTSALQQGTLASEDTGGTSTLQQGTLASEDTGGTSTLQQGTLASEDTGGTSADQESQQTQGGHHHHHPHIGGSMDAGASADSTGPSSSTGSSDSSGGGADSLLSPTDATGATTLSVPNSDGSTTTTITYADGSKVETTSAPASSGGSQPGPNNSANGNFLEQLIQVQAQSITPASGVAPTNGTNALA